MSHKACERRNLLKKGNQRKDSDSEPVLDKRIVLLTQHCDASPILESKCTSEEVKNYQES
jgi:hypothetical protein